MLQRIKEKMRFRIFEVKKCRPFKSNIINKHCCVRRLYGEITETRDSYICVLLLRMNSFLSVKKLAIVTLTAFHVQAQEKLIADLSLETTLLLDTLNA